MVMQHLLGLSPITEITAVITSASVAGFRTWIWLRRSAAAEHARTCRLIAALLGARSQDHAEVVRACAELEAAVGSTASFGRSRRGYRREGAADSPHLMMTTERAEPGTADLGEFPSPVRTSSAPSIATCT